MGGDRVPVNSSTHLPVVWRFKSEEPTVPNLKEDEEKIKSRRLPRPDWRHKIDLELYRKLEKVYVKTAMEITKDLPAPWRIKTMEYMLSQASHKSRMIIPDQEERKELSRQWFAKRISDKTRELYNKKYHLAGDFCGLSSRSAMFSAEIFPGLNKGPFLAGA